MATAWALSETSEAEGDRIENNHTDHGPKGDQSDRYQKIYQSCLSMANSIANSTPVSHEQSLAMTKLVGKLTECCFWANAALDRNEQ